MDVKCIRLVKEWEAHVIALRNRWRIAFRKRKRASQPRIEQITLTALSNLVVVVLMLRISFPPSAIALMRESLIIHWFNQRVKTPRLTIRVSLNIAGNSCYFKVYVNFRADLEGITK